MDHLGDVCDLWATLNEPIVLIGDGYLEDKVPPQIASPTSALKAGHNMVSAHRFVTARLHEIQPTLPSEGQGLRGIGLVNSLDLYDAADESNPLDRGVTDIVTDLSNWESLDAAVRGPAEIDRLVSKLGLPSLTHVSSAAKGGETVPHGSPIVDWIGINYYTRSTVQFKWFDRPDVRAADRPKGDNGWTVFPQGLERIIRETAQRFAGIPIVITENGVSDDDDHLRPQFIRDTLNSWIWPGPPTTGRVP